MAFPAGPTLPLILLCFSSKRHLAFLIDKTDLLPLTARGIPALCEKLNPGILWLSTFYFN